MRGVRASRLYEHFLCEQQNRPASVSMRGGSVLWRLQRCGHVLAIRSSRSCSCDQVVATFAVTLPVDRSRLKALPFTTRSTNWVPLKVTTELRVVTIVPFVASVRVTL